MEPTNEVVMALPTFIGKTTELTGTRFSIVRVRGPPLGLTGPCAVGSSSEQNQIYGSQDVFNLLDLTKQSREDSDQVNTPLGTLDLLESVSLSPLNPSAQVPVFVKKQKKKKTYQKGRSVSGDVGSNVGSLVFAFLSKEFTDIKTFSIAYVLQPIATKVYLRG